MNRDRNTGTLNKTRPQSDELQAPYPFRLRGAWARVKSAAERADKGIFSRIRANLFQRRAGGKSEHAETRG